MTATDTVLRVLSPDVRERLFRPTGEAIGLPGDVYTDPEFFAAERKAVFGREWVCVGVAADVANPGDQLPLTIAGIPVLMVRDMDGTIRAFHNICRHRGAQLVAAPVRRRAVVCPYHAWSYALDGTLTRTPGFCGPDQDAHDGFDPARHGLLPIRCERWHHLVFINLDPDAPPLLETLSPLLRRWSDYDFSLLRHDPAGSSRWDLAANWKLAIENFVERYHLPFVHPTLNGVSSIKHTLHITDGTHFVGVGSRNFAQPLDVPLPVFPGLPEDRRMRADYVAIFPNVMFGVHYNHCYAFMLQPLDAGRTLERFEFFFVGDESMADALAPSRDTIFNLIRLVNGEDIDIVQRLQIGCGSPAMQGSVFSPVMEDTTHRFQKIVVERITQMAS